MNEQNINSNPINYDGTLTLDLLTSMSHSVIDANIVEVNYMGRIQDLQKIIDHLREENVAFAKWNNELQTKLNEVYYRRGVSY